MDQRKGKTKRQHYVPRMILRNFSSDEDGRRISLVTAGKRIHGTSLRDQCQEDYFYGADQVMEDSFAKEEAKMATFFGDLAPERFTSLAEDDVHQLRLFMAYQHARTRAAAEHISASTGAFVKEAARGTAILNQDAEVSTEDIDAVEVRMPNGQHEAIWHAAKSHPIFFDMRVKFIMTGRTPGFVIADHPVVANNQFAQHHPILSRYPTSAGLASKGLQLFMPLSPSMTLAMFDPSTYEYGGKSDVCTAGPDDVAYLNRMQAVNAYSSFYFNDSRMTDEVLKDLVGTRANHPSVFKKNVSKSAMIQKPDGTVGQFIAVHQTEVRVGAKFSFIRPTDFRSYEEHEGASVPIRSDEVMRFAKLYGEMLEKEVAERRSRKEPRDPSDDADPA